ncbi:MAG TPA: DASS family sodium-coupled anion symporter [Bacteroidota bacterium]
MTARQIGFILGIVASASILLAPVLPVFLDAARGMIETGRVTALSPAELADSMQIVFALLVLMVAWWLTEAIPLPATALLPLMFLPWFHTSGLHNGEQVSLTLRNVLPNYASPVIFLFLGGFLLAGAMQKWKLDRRFTLWFLTRGSIANDARSILLGVMTVTAFLSMWVSNTATAAMMLPLGLGILSLLGASPGSSRFGTALMLGIAWSASIGGVGTIIGTPPNGIALGILDSTFQGEPSYNPITFLDWMAFGVPLVIAFIPFAWWMILKTNPPEFTLIEGGKRRMLEEQVKLGPLNPGEKRTIAVFSATVLFWVTNPFWDILLPAGLAGQVAWVDEYTIGITAGLMLFVVPVSFREGIFVLDWRDAKYVDWGTLLLFGGGIALSDAMFKTGLASLIASSFIGLFGTPSTLVMLVLVVLFVDFLTEITSNTAVTSMMVPIVISIAVSSGEDPVTVVLGAALAASMAFMLPVATPPNAIVFSSGHVRVRDMIRSGFLLDIAAWVFIIADLVVIGGWFLGIVTF